MAKALRLPPRMTVEQFLVWDDGTGTRYELENGVPVAMAPAALPHGVIAQNVGEIINERVRDRPPCRAVQAGGIVVSHEKRRYYIPDVVMTCEPPHRDVPVKEPRLAVEILSPRTRGIDQRQKVPRYGRLPSVEEIWLVDSQARRVLVWHRHGEEWPEPLSYAGEESFPSAVLGGEVSLDRLYRLSGIEA